MVLTTIGVVRAMLFLLALCTAGAVAGKLFLDRANTSGSEPGGRRSSPAHTTQIAGNDNFFGEEDRSDK